MLEILEVMREVELGTGDGGYMYMVGNRGFSLSRQGDKGTVEQWNNGIMGQWYYPRTEPARKTQSQRKKANPSR